MELAISPSMPALPASDLVDLAVEAEGLGYRSAWVAEVAGPEAFSLLGAIAARTKTIDLGVAVVPAMTRSPALLAMAAGTVSQLLGGRSLGLGIGSSSHVIVEQWHDAAFTPPLARVRETVEATRALLEGERGYDGTYVSSQRFRLASMPDGPVGIFVGALGPRMLRVAGAVGDGVCLNLMPASAVERQLAEVSRGAEQAGRELPDDFRVMARFHVVITDDPDVGRGLIRGAFGPYFAQPVYNRFLEWLGHEEEAAAISSAFAAGDREALARSFHDALVDGVSLVGTADEIRGRLSEYGEAGVEVAALNIIGDAAAIARGLQALAV